LVKGLVTWGCQWAASCFYLIIARYHPLLLMFVEQKRIPMKAILITLVLVITAQFGFSQCTASLIFSGSGSLVNIEFVAGGAVTPEYIIDWGDGTSDTLSTPFFEHEYPSDGTYFIFYSYEDLSNPNCYFNSYESILITGGSCSLSFELETVELVATVQATSDNTSMPSYTVDWGDGSPLQIGESLLHEYAQPGYYFVCVTMTDLDPALPCSITDCREVEIIGEGNACPVALDVALFVQTANISVNGNGGAEAEYIIDWGDGTFDMSPVTAHTYEVPALYTACVYYGVPGNTSCQSSACAEVNIDPFSGDCFFDFIPVISDSEVELQVFSGGATNPEYFVDWGDGTSGYYELPLSHVYTESGTYQISATYTDLNNIIGCQLNTTATVTVTSVSGGCELEWTVMQNGSIVNVEASGIGAVEPTYSVDWGDGSAPLLANSGSHTYQNIGVYQLCILYEDASDPACSSTLCEDIVVSSVAVEELDVMSNLRVWPNPFNDVVTIEVTMPLSHEINLRLLDATGRPIMVFSPLRTIVNSPLRLDLNAVPRGVYLLECSASSGNRVVRLVK